MADTSMALQVADSLLNDVMSNAHRMEALDRQHQREKLAKDLLKDVARAFGEIDKAAAQGVDVTYTRAKAHSVKGQIYFNVAESPELESWFTTVIINKWMRKKYAQNFVNKWAGQALAEYNQSLQIMPLQVVHYEAGLALFALERKAEAQSHFEQAQQGDDREIAMEAAKAITRMNEKQGFCFVATACYGSYEHPDVVIFRQWRDEVLLTSCLGRVGVECYYRISPPLAGQIGRLPFICAAIRKLALEPLARRLKQGR